MNHRQRIVILCAAVLMVGIKLVLPPFPRLEPEGGGDDRMIWTRGFMLLLAGVAVVTVVLLLVFQRKR